MKPSTQRMISLVSSAALLIMSLVVFSNLIRPEYSETQEMRGRISMKSQLFGEQGAATAQIQRLVADYQGLASIQDTLSLLIPQEEHAPQALNQVTNIAKANNLDIQSINTQKLPFQPKKPGQTSLLIKRVGVLRVDIQLSGTYEALKAFIQTIETNIRIMDVQRIDIATQSDPNKPYLFNVTIDTYYQES